MIVQDNSVEEIKESDIQGELFDPDNTSARFIIAMKAFEAAAAAGNS